MSMSSPDKIPSFQAYIAEQCNIIHKKRTDLNDLCVQKIIHANSPFELYPNHPIQTNKRLKYGALLIHGLLDSPFSLRDIAHHLKNHGILSRAILLPGHGTIPDDLLSITYDDWIKAVRFGIDSLKNQVEQIFMVGYSTGAALSIYHAYQESAICGMILLSPAIKIKAPIRFIVHWHRFIKKFGRDHYQWLYKSKENDYAKYQSIPFNAITQVAKLTDVIQTLHTKHSLETPLFLIMSHDDETVSSRGALQFFKNLPHPASRFMLYTTQQLHFNDSRICTRFTHPESMHIKHYAHAAIPFSPNNLHYGMMGDYETTSISSTISYNPDFSYMANEIVRFIKNQ
ncbi:MAG: hypothetical protein ACD_45C00259G0002 [uncultured bacterium]|nr:MAG: hypothetical protein ACD_45C00259G0002 [uncultured bacterium]OGT54711.1 MAG: hypothetical protein A3F43_05915 [Gammaproteobacteria bacterium RIFCSPHIGHO2_12_FULL_42_10]